MNLQDIINRRVALIKQREAGTAKLNAEIDDLAGQMKQGFHEEGLRRSPKWAAMTDLQRNHYAFMGFDPDDPDVPLD